MYRIGAQQVARASRAQARYVSSKKLTHVEEYVKKERKKETNN